MLSPASKGLISSRAVLFLSTSHHKRAKTWRWRRQRSIDEANIRKDIGMSAVLHLYSHNNTFIPPSHSLFKRRLAPSSRAFDQQRRTSSLPKAGVRGQETAHHHLCSNQSRNRRAICLVGRHTGNIQRNRLFEILLESYSQFIKAAVYVSLDRSGLMHLSTFVILPVADRYAILLFQHSSLAHAEFLPQFVQSIQSKEPKTTIHF